MTTSALPLPRRDAAAILVSLGAVTLLCWVYLAAMARDMASGSCPMGALGIHGWSAGYFWMMFTMWAVMMVGMMLPTAAPMVLIYAAIARKSERQGTPVGPVGAFVAGYLLIWTTFSLAATLAQWGLDRLALLSPAMVSTSPYLGAGLVATAGVYQFSAVKNRCLEHCRAPAHFLSRHWRSGSGGALRLGLIHGTFCLGCCWALMLLLFVGGVMNLVWVAAITFFVLLEKAWPVTA